MNPLILVALPNCSREESTRWEEFLGRHSIPFERRESMNEAAAADNQFVNLTSSISDDFSESTGTSLFLNLI